VKGPVQEQVSVVQVSTDQASEDHMNINKENMSGMTKDDIIPTQQNLAK